MTKRTQAYKFQIETGYIAAGMDEIKIVKFIGEVDLPISRAMQQLIDAHGGEPVEATKPKRKAAKKKESGQ